MENLLNLFQSILDLIIAVFNVAVSFGAFLLPWAPLAAWIAFWLFGVNWVQLRKVLLQGGCIAIFLIGFVMILVWGSVAPPADGVHQILGLKLSNFVGKTVYVTALFTIMFLCGSVQLAGCCSRFCCFSDEDQPADDTHQPAH